MDYAKIWAVIDQTLRALWQAVLDFFKKADEENKGE